jgi:hypothetical protein
MWTMFRRDITNLVCFVFPRYPESSTAEQRLTVGLARDDFC